MPQDKGAVRVLTAALTVNPIYINIRTSQQLDKVIISNNITTFIKENVYNTQTNFYKYERTLSPI